MRIRPYVRGLFLAAACALAASSALAGEKAKGPAAPPDKEAMMKAWMEVATPGEAHKKLEPMAGGWNAKVKAWFEPGGPADESEGTSEIKWVLGGRFLEQRHEGKLMGQPFTGLGYTGYDNYKKKYVGTWMDSAGTMIMMMTGTIDKSGKVLTTTGTIDDVLAKKPVKVKGVSTIVDADTMHYEMFAPGPDGKMFKNLDIVYTRKK